MIFTTNKSLKAWGRVLHDEDLAQAIIDRVLERGRLLRLDGPSVRTLHVNLDEAMKEDSGQEADLVRISGKRWSEFPEPTAASVQSTNAHPTPGEILAALSAGRFAALLWTSEDDAVECKAAAYRTGDERHGPVIVKRRSSTGGSKAPTNLRMRRSMLMLELPRDRH